MKTPHISHLSPAINANIAVGWVGRGMHLQFSFPDSPRQITTTTISEIVEQNGSSPEGKRV